MGVHVAALLLEEPDWCMAPLAKYWWARPPGSTPLWNYRNKSVTSKVEGSAKPAKICTQQNSRFEICRSRLYLVACS